jgi:hypothetical protein
MGHWLLSRALQQRDESCRNLVHRFFVCDAVDMGPIKVSCLQARTAEGMTPSINTVQVVDTIVPRRFKEFWFCFQKRAKAGIHFACWSKITRGEFCT